MKLQNKERSLFIRSIKVGLLRAQGVLYEQMEDPSAHGQPPHLPIFHVTIRPLSSL
jgi:hypothetical protein